MTTSPSEQGPDALDLFGPSAAELAAVYLRQQIELSQTRRNRLLTRTGAAFVILGPKGFDVGTEQKQRVGEREP